MVKITQFSKNKKKKVRITCFVHFFIWKNQVLVMSNYNHFEFMGIYVNIFIAGNCTCLIHPFQIPEYLSYTCIYDIMYISDCTNSITDSLDLNTGCNELNSCIAGESV